MVFIVHYRVREEQGMSKAQNTEQGAKVKEIEVTVTFPLAHGQPFHGKHTPETTVGTVRAEVMRHFGIQEEPNSTYYLTHGGSRVADGANLASVAGKAEAVKFTLVKELVQG
jgi:hypothetical protein